MEEHCYIISYDLCTPESDYSSLYKAIKSYDKWGRLTESTWAIVTEQNHVEIRDYLMQFMHPNDKLIVILSGKRAAWTQVLASNEWVKTYLVK